MATMENTTRAKKNGIKLKNGIDNKVEPKTKINNEVKLKNKIENQNELKNNKFNSKKQTSNNVKSNLNKMLTLENILCLFVILCPIFDISSFAFRNIFNTTISISTFVRPIIPIIVGIIIFIKGSRKEKKSLIIISAIYIIYGLLHLYIAKTLLTGCSYGTVMNELQYIFNFTFLIIDLIIYAYVFIIKDGKDKNIQKNKIDKLKKSITIMLSIYITSIYIAILTKTSSYTYAETQTGYKGWIESGNSLSAILILSLFIAIEQIKSKDTKWKIFSIITVILTAVYLTTLIGTRTGLFGFFIVLGLMLLLEVIFSKNKKIIISGGIIFLIAIVGIGILGSSTIQRRKQMNEAKNTIIDESTGEVGNMTGDMLRIKNKIINNELEEGYMSEAQKQSVIDLYNYSKEHNVAGNDTRTQQLMYNMFLVKNQKNILALLFGNGYKTNFREMVMENELASMILNFGILGFTLYIIPFIAILVYSIAQGIKNRKKLNPEFAMCQAGLALSLLLSWLSGYVFFASSSMIVIVVISIILLNKSIELKKYIN